LIDDGRRTATEAGEVVEAVKNFDLIRRKINEPPRSEPLLPTTPR
jgi:hypothetical protein